MTTLLTKLRTTTLRDTSLYVYLKTFYYECDRDVVAFQDYLEFCDNEMYDFARDLHECVHNAINSWRALHMTAEQMREGFPTHKIQVWVNQIRNEMYESYTPCYECDNVVPNDDAIYIEGSGEYVCGDCCDSSYRYHDGHGQYYHEDDYPYEDDEDDYYEENGVHGYDYDVTNELSSKYHGNEKRLLGVEIEVERRSNAPYEIAETVEDAMRGFALCKHDGSLNNGFEIVTAPSTISYQKKKWSDFCQKNFADDLSSWNTSTCGMHIHVDRASVTPLDIGKLLVFVNGKHNREFIERIAGRSSAQWSAFKTKQIKDSLHRSDKYEALATHKPRTIEFRIFRGNIAKQGIFRNLEFVDSICNFVKTVGIDKDTESVNSLSYTNYVRYMTKSESRGQYPYLFSWLVRKGYTQGKSKNIQNESEES
jgi:hypothetical protein